MNERPRLGYIGLGLMGLPMAKRLRDAGYVMAVWGRSPAKFASLVADGAEAMPNAAAVAEASDIVFTCLTDTEAVEAVAFGDRGVAGRRRAGEVAGRHVVDPPRRLPGDGAAFARRHRHGLG